MKRMIALIVGVKIGLLGISLAIEKPVEVVEAYEDPRPIVELMTTSEYKAYVEERDSEPILVEVEINWTEERIIEEIRETFPEAPNTAVAIAKCESGLKADIQSSHQLSYGREESFGIFQIHARDHEKTAKHLGLDNYKTDPSENIQMARYLKDKRGNWNDWMCYTKGLWKNYL